LKPTEVYVAIDVAVLFVGHGTGGMRLGPTSSTDGSGRAMKSRNREVLSDLRGNEYIGGSRRGRVSMTFIIYQ